MGIDVYKPYESKEIERKARHFASFTVSPLPMLDKEMRVWQHSNADKSECPCYGFYIRHPEMGSTVYITDTKCVVWNFSKQKLNHIIISANYDQRLLCDDEAKRNHVLTGHLSVQEACRWIEGNKTNALRNVILCHMSRENANVDEMVAEVQKIAPAANVDYADKDKEWELNELPF